MKNKLILRAGEFTSFTSHYLISVWNRYFDISHYDADKTYDRHNTLFAVNWPQANDEYSQRLRDQGYRVIVDNLMEPPIDVTDYYLILNPNWCWYNESVLWRYLGYDQYQPNKNYSKLSLMPIRRQSKIRDHIVDKMGTRLDNFVWSYQGQALPGDISWDIDGYQRFFNPGWYDDTYFSTVVETWQEGKCDLISEKIFKPLAYYHPFVAIGQLHTLTRLHQLGFETYENLFDESYDDIVNFDQRFDAVINAIDNFDPQPYDSITMGKLQHNHAHFFNQTLVESRIVTEIIEPLINYIET